jgi:hypothetical protein
MTIIVSAGVFFSRAEARHSDRVRLPVGLVTSGLTWLIVLPVL